MRGWGLLSRRGEAPGKKGAEGTPPGFLSWKSWLTVFPFPVSQLPLPKALKKKKKKKIHLHILITERSGGGAMPACRVSMPFPANHPLSLPPPDTLTRPRQKWFCFGFRVDEALRTAGLGPDTQPSRPSPKRNYLLMFSGFRRLGGFSTSWGRGDSPLPQPAVLPAFILRAAGSPGAHLGAQSHHRAGLSKPWSSGRVQLALRDPAASWRWLQRS